MERDTHTQIHTHPHGPIGEPNVCFHFSLLCLCSFHQKQVHYFWPWLLRFWWLLVSEALVEQMYYYTCVSLVKIDDANGQRLKVGEVRETGKMKRLVVTLSSLICIQVSWQLLQLLKENKRVSLWIGGYRTWEVEWCNKRMYRDTSTSTLCACNFFSSFMCMCECISLSLSLSLSFSFSPVWG